MAHCRAFVFPGEEDFGITPLEANAAGRPVIGALDTVVDGMNGILFHTPTVEGLIEALERFEPGDFDSEMVRSHAERFDTRVFQEAIRGRVRELAG
jgi:glycosyltransferase involved in cell wall biosynthesis